jgi:hypothetical protein
MGTRKSDARLVFVAPLLLLLLHFILQQYLIPSDMASRILQFFRLSSPASKEMTVSVAPLFKNDPAPGVDEYYPLNDPAIGTPYSSVRISLLLSKRHAG